MHLLKKKKNTYPLISTKKCFIMLLLKEQKITKYCRFIDAETLFDDIKSKKVGIEDLEKKRTEFESKLISVRIGGNKSKKQLSEIENITKFYKSQEEVNKYYNDYLEMVHKDTYDWKRSQNITSKQLLPRLRIAFAQVKAGNTSEKLLNEICQIIYSLYQEKEITKEVYDSIMKAIKLQ